MFCCALFWADACMSCFSRSGDIVAPRKVTQPQGVLMRGAYLFIGLPSLCADGETAAFYLSGVHSVHFGVFLFECGGIKAGTNNRG